VGKFCVAAIVVCKAKVNETTSICMANRIFDFASFVFYRTLVQILQLILSMLKSADKTEYEAWLIYFLKCARSSSSMVWNF
jgi:hypothetical protein